MLDELFKKRFTVYFQIGDKKMKMTVSAENPFEAQHIVEKKLNILKVEPSTGGIDDIINNFIDQLK